MSDSLQTPAVERTSSLSDYIALCKVRLNVLVLITTLTGMYLAALHEVLPLPSLTVFLGLAGAALCAFGSSAINMVLEKDQDARMRRTENRPIAAGRLSVAQGATAGVTLILSGLVLLSLLNWLTMFICSTIVLSYVAMCTPLKRVSSLSSVIGPVTGALPPVLGWAAVTADIPHHAWVLFGIMFLWQLPHFLALAWRHRDQYEAAGMPMLPVIDPDGGMTARQMTLQSVALLIVSVMPFVYNFVGPVYLVVALLLGGWFLMLNIRFLQKRSDDRAREVFLASLLYLPLLFGVLVLDKALDLGRLISG
jgi:protoheme IX farnesyltransferase